MSASLGLRLRYNSIRSDTSGVDYATIQQKLSIFQIEKLTYFFKSFLDNNRDGIVDAKDFKALSERLRKLAGWESDSEEFGRIEDTMAVFLECLLDQVKAEFGSNADGLEFRTWEEAFRPRMMVVDCVTLNQWLNMWAKLCDGAHGMNDFPIWVQLLPKILFKAIVGNSLSNKVTKPLLRHFYENFIGIAGKDLEDTTEDGFRTMTGDEEYELNLENYSLLFANFLLGRTIYGPGKYIFGCFDNRDMKEKYRLNYA